MILFYILFSLFPTFKSCSLSVFSVHITFLYSLCLHGLVLLKSIIKYIFLYVLLSTSENVSCAFYIFYLLIEYGIGGEALCVEIFEIDGHQHPRVSSLVFIFCIFQLKNNFMRLGVGEITNACPHFANLIPFLQLLVYPLQLISGRTYIFCFGF